MSERPLRAYSVGSRLEHSKRKFRIDHSLSSSLASNSSSNSRTRAFSVGSRAKMPRSDQYKSSCMGSTPAQIALFNNVQSYNNSLLNDNNNNKNGNSNTSSNNSANKKSSSVPILDNTIQQTPSSDRSMKSSNEELMNDFMEMDFSSMPIGKITEGHDDDKMHMDTGAGISNTSHDYLNMMPSSLTSSGNSDGYVEMHPVGMLNSSESIASSPVKQYYSITPRSSTSLKSNTAEESNYLDMRGKESLSSTASPKSSLSSFVVPPTLNNSSSLPKAPTHSSSHPSQTDDYLNMSPVNRDLASNPSLVNNAIKVPSASSSALFPVRGKDGKVIKSVEDGGYLEMTFSRQSSHQSNSSSSSADFQRQQEKFMSQRKMMSNPANQNRSLPININYNTNVYNGAAGSSNKSENPAIVTPRNNVGVLSKLSSEESPFLVSNPQTPLNKIPIPSTTSTPTIFPFSPGSTDSAGNSRK